ncbi:PhoU domain-containing protein [Thermus igniterrae]|uniref:PhoU domain-containing protein n=1 Tax=Thermus igniterrae TaxID=88189 RepID=UPI0003719A0F|nr:PhoU domain-containing protein [Thermus igniterrae]
MGFLAGLALFLLGVELLAQGLAPLRGRRHLLGRALGHPSRTLFFGLLAGLVSGSGSGVSLLALGLLEGRVLGLSLAALLALAATAGAAPWVGVFLLGQGGLEGAFWVAGLLLFPFPRGRSLALGLWGLGLLLLGFAQMGAGAEGVARLLASLDPSPGLMYLAGLALALVLGSANGVAAMALALAPALPAGLAQALVLGAGVGTTGSLFLAFLGGRREALALGAVLGLHRLLLSLGLFLLARVFPMGVLETHLLSHLLYALAFFPLRRGYEALAQRLFPVPQVVPKYLSPEALESPLLAQALVRRELARVADAVRAMLAKAVRILAQEEGGEAELSELEEKVDHLTREVVLYTAQLSARAGDERAVALLVAASELEHLGDQVRRVVRQAERLWGQGLSFSQEGKEDLLEAARLVLGRLERMAAAWGAGEKALAQEVLSEGPQVAAFLDRLRRAHLLRLEAGREESRATTLAHLDLLLTLEDLSAGVERLCRHLLEL